MAPAERGMIDSDVMMLVSLVLMQERLVQGTANPSTAPS